MKNCYLVLITVLLFAACNNTKHHKEVLLEQRTDLSYDSTLAAKYGADDYGMKKYVIAFLYRGANREQDSAKAAELQRAHLDNIGRMAEAGTLVLAGPFFGNDDLRGIYVFDVQSLEEARALSNTDPAIQTGHLRLELKEWYGSAALMGLSDIYPKISKKEI